LTELFEPIWPVDLNECRIWPMEGDDGPLLQELFDDMTDFPLVLGERGAADAVSTFISLPEGKDYDAKILVGLWKNGALLGALDCIVEFPTQRDWTVGMLVVAERHRRQGIGSSVLRWLEGTARSRGAENLRVGLLARNVVGAAFLRRCGYTVEEGAPTAQRDILVAQKRL
jgi:GNAT superfamily N-acetyltransferase